MRARSSKYGEVERVELPTDLRRVLLQEPQAPQAAGAGWMAYLR